MPLVTKNQSIGAGASLSIMADSIYEFLPWAALLEFAVLGSAAGLLFSISSGSDILAEEQPVGLGTLNVPPKYPDDFQLNDVAGQSEKIKFLVKNPTGGAISCMAAVRITPA